MDSITVWLFHPKNRPVKLSFLPKKMISFTTAMNNKHIIASLCGKSNNVG